MTMPKFAQLENGSFGYYNATHFLPQERPISYHTRFSPSLPHLLWKLKKHSLLFFTISSLFLKVSLSVTMREDALLAFPNLSHWTWHLVSSVLYRLFSPPCLYIFLNLVIITIVVTSGGLKPVKHAGLADTQADNRFIETASVGPFESIPANPATVNELTSVSVSQENSIPCFHRIIVEDAAIGSSEQYENSENEDASGEMEMVDIDEIVSGISMEELNARAEAFILKFHQQLRMERAVGV